MTIAPVSALGAEPSQALKQVAESVQSQGGNTAKVESSSNANITLGNSIPASSSVQQTASNGSVQPGFANTVLDGVYTQIDKLSSKLPQSAEQASPIDVYKDQMASQVEALNPSEAGSLAEKKDGKVEALSKTFDHAIFMAMVNQVVSGVSDTSRTLIKQS